MSYRESDWKPSNIYSTVAYRRQGTTVVKRTSLGQPGEYRFEHLVFPTIEIAKRELAKFTRKKL